MSDLELLRWAIANPTEMKRFLIDGKTPLAHARSELGINQFLLVVAEARLRSDTQAFKIMGSSLDQRKAIIGIGKSG